MPNSMAHPQDSASDLMKSCPRGPSGGKAVTAGGNQAENTKMTREKTTDRMSIYSGAEDEVIPGRPLLWSCRLLLNGS